MIVLVFATFLLYHSAIVRGKTNCICEDDAIFQNLCKQGKEIIEQSPIPLNFLACYCLCPSLSTVKVLYPWVAAMKWDLYHSDQLNFFKAVHNTNLLKGGGIIMGGWGDHSTVTVEVRNQLSDLNILMASHSLLKSELGIRVMLHEDIQCSYCQSYSKASFPSTFTNLILIPDHLFIRNNGYSHLLNRFNGPEVLSFEQRQPLIMWRGSPNSMNYGEIMNLRYLMCLKAKNLSWLDIGLTKAYNAQSEQLYHQQGVMKSPVPEHDWSNYRGIIDIDGSVNAWGLIWRLGSGSTVFLVESNYTNAYMERMVPFVHYIPLKADLSDFEVLTELIRQPHLVPLLERIAKNAKQLVDEFTLEKEVHRVVRELNYYWDSSIIKIVD